MPRHAYFIANVVLLMILSQSVIASAADRPMLIGYREKPGVIEENEIRGEGGNIRRKFKHLPVVSAHLSDKAIEKLKKKRNIAYIEEDGVVAAVEPVADSNEYQDSWGVLRIGAPAAHAKDILGAGIKVAVLDTGIDYLHADLAANYQGGYDFMFNDSDPHDDSWNGHGTHVAGIIAAVRNDLGVVGVAPAVSLYAVKVLDGAGFGNVSTLIEGIDWAIENQMDIVNISIGVGVHYQALQDACDAAFRAGLLLVAASGNDPGGPVTFPAAYDSVIAVTGTNQGDTVGYFAPTGPENELAAPGLAILSTVAGGGYGYMSGTSQASPHVSGVAALIMSAGISDINQDGVLNNLDVRAQLQQTAVDLGVTGRDGIYGFGLVDAAAAVGIDDAPPQTTVLELVKGYKKENDTALVTLVGGVFQIAVENDSLRALRVVVKENGVLRKDLSGIYHLGHRPGKQITRVLDLTAGKFDLLFEPIGRPGSAATVTITRE